MKLFLRGGAVAAVCLLVPAAALAIDRSECRQYGGTRDCWPMLIGPWKYDACGQVGAFNSYEQAVCRAQGGTGGGYYAPCEGLPAPEYRRPTSEGDIAPYAEDIFSEYYGTLCEGPTSQSFAWGGVYYSNLCFSGSGAVYQYGYERSNAVTPFAVTGKRVLSGVCQTTDTSLMFTARRDRAVHCSSVNTGPTGGGEDFYATSGATPALCNEGARQPINPKQKCDTCTQVGNPIDPNTGVKQQVELDYGGTGPHPLRFERIYNSRIYTRDGRQWRHNYFARIENQEFGTVPVAVAFRPSGRVFLFHQASGVYVAPIDIDDRITRINDGGGALAGWQYYDAATDNLESYDAEGKLLSVTNR
ncbi:MAG: DUF6531 domain-containing protein, partial [Betaproteobacteria bacterium]|nr:DUF6531 domain-containing protein [Betaproteobacteria bacterium]